ncbi:hypothetical protein ACT691_11850 [Vibrio metschnikovii]
MHINVASLCDPLYNQADILYLRGRLWLENVLRPLCEVGESIAENFYNKIGWGLPQKGVYYPCIKPQKHALSTSKKGEKTQHGIDFQVSYKSSLESETLNHLIISVKHAKDSKYPASATEKFKGYIRDLVHTRE